MNIEKEPSTLRISGNVATCMVINSMSTNKESKITMTLQKSTDKSMYSKVQAWNQESADIGTKILTLK